MRACDERLCDALLDAGEPEESEAVARRVLAALEADSDAAPAARTDARLRLGLALSALARADEARTELEGGLSGPPGSAHFRTRAEAALAELDPAR